ncbi:MAG: hypothetical protein K2O18_16985 [Oscillospiraceae bacterium]|nr:hypothetical protein [Oscillospiraceae bacterium]
MEEIPWGEVPSGIADDLFGKTVLFRFPANDKKFASESVSVTMPTRADGPILTLNRKNMTVNTDTSMEYSSDNGETWSKTPNNMNVAGHPGEMLLFRYTETKASPASSITVLEIPAAISPPVLSLNMADELIVSGKESEVLEYSGDGGITWNTCAIPMEAGRVCGKTLLFRVPAYDVNFSGSVAALSIPVRAAAPIVSIDTANETVVTNPETGIEYSASSGETWTALRSELDVSGLTGETILVRTAYTDTMFHSESTIVTIPVRRDAPVVLVGPDKFEIPDGVEFSSDGGKTWGQVPSIITDNLLGKTVLFRFPADNANFSSKSARVALPDRADGPILAFDRASLTVNTDSSMEYSVDNGVAWTRAVDNMSVAGLLGKTLQFRYAAAAVMPASSITVLEIPAVISAPVLSLDMSRELLVSSKENESLEYSEDNGCHTVLQPGGPGSHS